MPKYIVIRNKKNQLSIKRNRTIGLVDGKHTDNQLKLESKTKRHALLTAGKFFSMIDEAKKKAKGSSVSQSTESKSVSKKDDRIQNRDTISPKIR